MKKTLLGSLLALHFVLFGEEPSVTALSSGIPVEPIVPLETLENPPAIVPQETKIPALAVALAVVPGLGHAYLGDTKTAFTLSGAGSLGLAGAFLTDKKDAEIREIGSLSFFSVESYGLYAAYRDARAFNGQSRYSYQMPTDSFWDLASASFRWSVLKKPEVWGGVLGCLGLAIGLSHIYPDVDGGRIHAMAVAQSVPSPWVAFPVGFSEESLFRGCLQSILSEGFGPSIGIPLSSIAFGLAHLGNAEGMTRLETRAYYTYSIPFIALLGGYLGWLTHKNHSIQESVAVHSWYDFTLFLAASMATETACTGRSNFSFSTSF